MEADRMSGLLIQLKYNGGGDIGIFKAKALYWHKKGYEVVIIDQQVSAAGIAVLEARRLGVPLYWRKAWFASPTLYLHQSKSKSEDGKSWVFRDDGAEYGFPSPINGYRKVTMKELGIPEWPKGKPFKPVQTIPAKQAWW